MPEISIQTSPGDAYDRLSILRVKLEKIKNQDKISVVERHFIILKNEIEKYSLSLERFEEKIKKCNVVAENLFEINKKLWEVEDDIRECESKKDFSTKFVDLARKVYHMNDKRHSLKLKIDEICDSKIAEQKEYHDYQKDSGIN